MPQLAVLFCFRFAQTTTATLTATAGSGRCTDSGHLTRHAHAGKSRQQHAHTHTHVQHTNDSLRRRRCRLCRRYHLRRFAVSLSGCRRIRSYLCRRVASCCRHQQRSSRAASPLSCDCGRFGAPASTLRGFDSEWGNFSLILVLDRLQRARRSR